MFYKDNFIYFQTLQFHGNLFSIYFELKMNKTILQELSSAKRNDARSCYVGIRGASWTASTDLYVAQARRDARGGSERRSAQFFNGSASCLASRWRAALQPAPAAAPAPRPATATLIPQSATARPHTGATLYFN
jgi:hypothetical protein